MPEEVKRIKGNSRVAMWSACRLTVYTHRADLASPEDSSHWIIDGGPYQWSGSSVDGKIGQKNSSGHFDLFAWITYLLS